MQPPTEVASSSLQYKGKVTRWWPQLPEEIVRLIATYYLWDISVTNYCPQTWENPKAWHHRMAYACIRDAMDLEKHIMPICPEWRRAIEKHLFWNQAAHVLDPNDVLYHHLVSQQAKQTHNGSSNAASPIRITAYHHLRNILNASCLICRINFTATNHGLGAAKKLAASSFFGTIPVCRDHHYRRPSFCGLCLRETPALHPHDTSSREFELSQAIGIIENEDEDTWPVIEATCRKCRAEWLWRKACMSQRDREAVGGPTFRSHDWETRQNIEGFVEMAEGTIVDVLTLAREKLWLRTFTKYDSLGQHLLAAQRTQPRPGGQEEEEEDSEEDKELMLMRGAGQVREMALNDWARMRILDGHWLSPADVWYGHTIPGQPIVVSTVHPCPWSREMDGSPAAGEEQHPSRATVLGEIPPSFSLCEQAYAAYLRQFREIIGPALKNIVRKIVMECSVQTEKGYDDPAHIARKMSLEQVVKILREEEGVWYDGFDWAEKKRNEDESLRRRRLEAAEAALMSVVEQKQRGKEDDASSTTSSGSGKSSTHGSSNATSPVLSTSTLQTTPSPSPISDEGSGTKKEEESNERQRSNADGPRLIPVDPVRSTPRLLAKIPYVPVTIAHLPQYSLEALRSAWRDACVPLYHCCCSVCERAKAVEMSARAAYAAIAPGVVPSQPVPQTLTTNIYSLADAQNVDTTEIELKEVNEADLDGEGEEEIDYVSDYEDDEEEDEDGNMVYDVETNSFRYSGSPEDGTEPDAPPSRKRSCDELDDGHDIPDDASSEAPSSLMSGSDPREQGGTPPKRPRLGDTDLLRIPSEEKSVATAARLKKRSSEELELDDEDAPLGPVFLASNKRIRVRAPPLPPSASPRSVYSSVDEGEEDMPYVPPPAPGRGQYESFQLMMQNVPNVDLDQLIPMDDTEE